MFLMISVSLNLLPAWQWVLMLSKGSMEICYVMPAHEPANLIIWKYRSCESKKEWIRLFLPIRMLTFVDYFGDYKFYQKLKEINALNLSSAFNTQNSFFIYSLFKRYFIKLSYLLSFISPSYISKTTKH